MTKTDTVTIRVNPDLKREAEALCEDMGLTLSTAYTIFLKAVVRTRSIPFRISASSAQLNKETVAAIEEVEQGVGLSKTFATSDELMEDLLSHA